MQWQNVLLNTENLYFLQLISVWGIICIEAQCLKPKGAISANHHFGPLILWFIFWELDGASAKRANTYLMYMVINSSICQAFLLTSDMFYHMLESHIGVGNHQRRPQRLNWRKMHSSVIMFAMYEFQVRVIYWPIIINSYCCSFPSTIKIHVEDNVLTTEDQNIPNWSCF